MVVFLLFDYYRYPNYNWVMFKDLEKDIVLLFKKVGIDKQIDYTDNHFIFTETIDNKLDCINGIIKNDKTNIIQLHCLIKDDEHLATRSLISNQYYLHHYKKITITLTKHKNNRLYLKKRQRVFDSYVYDKYKVYDVICLIHTMANIYRLHNSLDKDLSVKEKPPIKRINKI